MKLAPLLLGLCLVGAACTSKKDGDPPAPKPTAAFAVAATAGTSAPVQTNNLSTNATSYMWNWGDGTTSTDQTPQHNYNAVGTFRVQLQAAGASGVDTVSQVVQVRNDGPPTTTSAIAGLYRGRLIYNFSLPNQPSVHWQRDTVIQVIAVDARTLRLMTWDIPYAPGTVREPSLRWIGHAPQRPNISFGSPLYSNRAYLQAEQYGDSIFFNTCACGRVGGGESTFYGKKRP